MTLSLSRIILYVQNVQTLTDFYRAAFGLTVVKEIKDEWAVLKAGHCELALHRVGKAFRSSHTRSARANNNAKFVFAVFDDVEALREKLITDGVPMGELNRMPALRDRSVMEPTRRATSF